jgi:hypothetical protein
MIRLLRFSVAVEAHAGATRSVQFQHTSESNLGAAKKNASQLSKWHTKSTREFMSEGERHSEILIDESGRSEKAAKFQKSVEKLRREELKALEMTRADLQRISLYSKGRTRKMIEFFKYQGTAFTIAYVVVYVTMLGMLYVAFATGLFPKSYAFDFVFSVFNYHDRDRFYERIEAWDTYVNMGFAVVVNELAEFIRLPVFLIMAFGTKNYLNMFRGRVRRSVWKRTAPES